VNTPSRSLAITSSCRFKPTLAFNLLPTKEWNLYLDAATAQVCSGCEILASIAFHHGLLGKCLRLRDSSMSRPGNTSYHSDEDSEQPRNQLQTDFMAAHIPHSVPFFPGFYFYNPLANPLLYYQQTVIAAADLSASALLYNHSARDLLLVDPFWVGPKRLSSLIPPDSDFPFYIDSIRAELFLKTSRYYRGNLIGMLDIFRKKFISAYGGNLNIKQVPSTFSITRANNFDISTQFGVSAPIQNENRSQAADLAAVVRNYRVRQCWGEQQPPPKSEIWKHGQCAENQSLSSVVAQCATLGLENVIINTLAMKKSGELVGMCKNCRSYVSHRVLRKHPTWKVVDYTTGTRISSS
jgi:hypothetical protein